MYVRECGVCVCVYVMCVWRAYGVRFCMVWSVVYVCT